MPSTLKNMLNHIRFIFICLTLTFSAYSAESATPMHLHASAHREVKVPQEVRENTLNSSEAAREIIYSIVNSVGLKPNFEIRQANISNAAAVSYKGKRFILYDAKFIQRIQKASNTDWAAVSILAHEIGHHLNGHTIMGKGSKDPALELEADEFSGFIMRQMGASLEDAVKAMKLISNEKGSSSHPARKARLAAIEKGYLNANDRILAYANQPMTKMAASYQYEEEEKVEQAKFALAQEEVFKNVYLNKFPNQTFYLTKELKLVVQTEKGTAVIGDLAKNKGRLLLNLYGKNRDSRLYISKTGKLVDATNRVVGYIKNPA
jgi:hypothetical protein